MIIRLVSLLAFVSFTGSSISAQHNRAWFVSPGMNIGYTFGAGTSYGIRLDCGVEKLEEKSYRYGISFSYSKIHTKRHVHRMRTFGFMGATDYSQLVLGWGRVRNKWGYGNRNKCITHGIYADASIAAPYNYSPWIGIKTFRYPPAGWAWFTKPYNTAYIEYRYDALSNPVIKNSVSFR